MKHMVNCHPFFSSQESYKTNETEEVYKRQNKGTEHTVETL